MSRHTLFSFCFFWSAGSGARAQPRLECSVTDPAFIPGGRRFDNQLHTVWTEASSAAGLSYFPAPRCLHFDRSGRISTQSQFPSSVERG
jgi:hypothetical protein